jgi:hypothetical protein
MDEFYPRVERFEDNFGHVKTPHGIAEGIYNTWVQAGDEVLFRVSVWNPQPEPAMLRAYVNHGTISYTEWQTDQLLRVEPQGEDIEPTVSVSIEMRSAWAHKHIPFNYVNADERWSFTYKGKPTFS